jgi:hypothetical protein
VGLPALQEVSARAAKGTRAARALGEAPQQPTRCTGDAGSRARRGRAERGKGCGIIISEERYAEMQREAEEELRLQREAEEAAHRRAEQVRRAHFLPHCARPACLNAPAERLARSKRQGSARKQGARRKRARSSGAGWGRAPAATTASCRARTATATGKRATWPWMETGRTSTRCRPKTSMCEVLLRAFCGREPLFSLRLRSAHTARAQERQRALANMVGVGPARAVAKDAIEVRRAPAIGFLTLQEVDMVLKGAFRCPRGDGLEGEARMFRPC